MNIRPPSELEMWIGGCFAINMVQLSYVQTGTESAESRLTLIQDLSNYPFRERTELQSEVFKVADFHPHHQHVNVIGLKPENAKNYEGFMAAAQAHEGDLKEYYSLKEKLESKGVI